MDGDADSRFFRILRPLAGLTTVPFDFAFSELKIGVENLGKIGDDRLGIAIRGAVMLGALKLGVRACLVFSTNRFVPALIFWTI